jgi:outer membrane protein
MKTFKRICPVFLVAFLCLINSVSTGFSMDLGEIIRLAFKHDAQLRADMFAAEARNADGWQSVAGYGPTLTASGSYMRSRDCSTPKNSTELESRVVDFKEGAITVGLTQPVIDLEKAGKAMQGMTEMDIAELLKKKAYEDLSLKVHERYFAVLSAQESLRVAQAESAALQKQVRNAEEKLELGFGTITDQYDAEARYRLALATEIAGRTELNNGLKALEELIDHEIVGEIEDLAADLVLPKIPGDVETWLKISDAQNTDLGLNRLQAKSAQLQYRAAQSRFLPALVLFADYSDHQPTDGLLGYGEERSEVDVGLRLEVSLLAGGRDSAATVAASRRVDAARARATAANRAVNRSVYSLWDSIDSTRRLVDAYRQAVTANEKALESTLASYEEGVKVLLDVLNAQQDYYRSLRQFKTSRYDYMILLEKFRQVVGVETVIQDPLLPTGGKNGIDPDLG